MRVGRQQFGFGKMRLVAPRPWSNTQRRWDGVSVIAKTGNFKTTAFATRFAPVQRYSFNDPDHDTPFYGAYSTGKVGDLGVDLYYLGIARAGVNRNGTTGNEDRHTVGFRLFGQMPEQALDYDFEFAHQFGRTGQNDISAYMVAAEIGHRMPDLAGKPRFTLGIDYATGDDNAGGDVETFDHLFPLGHMYLGWMDVIGRQNVIALSAGTTFVPCENTKSTIKFLHFLRESDNDAAYNPGGGVVRAGGLGTASEIGSEIDLSTAYKYSQHTNYLVGYSYFFAGDFIAQSGASQDTHFAYFQVQYTF